MFLYSVYSMFFGICIFKKKYTYTHITYVTATWGRVVFWWKGEAAKITEYTEYRKWMTPNRQMRCRDVTARGACVFLWRGEAAKITEYTEYRKWMAPYR